MTDQPENSLPEVEPGMSDLVDDPAALAAAEAELDAAEAAGMSQEVIDEFVVAAHHDLSKVQSMLAAHPELIDEHASWVETPLGAAAHTGNREIAEYLLAEGAPMDICAAAMLGRREDVAAFLAENPALVHATGAHDLPVLYHAAISGKTDIIDMLIAGGANVNEGEGRSTALHGAVGFGHADLVRWLLDMGADFTLTDHSGRLPLDVAESTGHEGIAALLRNYTGMQ
jgi:ankyrin repeat protein